MTLVITRSCLANLEAVLNIVANSLEVAGILVGTVMLIKAITRRREPGKLWKSLAIATLPIILGLATPGAVNWIVATARDAKLFA